MANRKAGGREKGFVAFVKILIAREGAVRWAEVRQATPGGRAKNWKPPHGGGFARPFGGRTNTARNRGKNLICRGNISAREKEEHHPPRGRKGLFL